MTNTIHPEQRLTILKHLANGRTLDQVATITHLKRDLVLDIANHHGYPDPTKLAWAVDRVAAIVEKQATTEGISTSPTTPSGVRLDQPLERVRPAPRPAPPPAPAVDQLQQLLDRATSSTHRLQKLAARVSRDLDTIRDLLAVEDAKAKARRDAEHAKARKAAEKLAAREAAKAQKQRAREAVRAERAARAAAARATGTGDQYSTPPIQQQLTAAGVTPKDIKTWAVAQGLLPEVKRGRLKADISQAYADAHPHLLQAGDAA